MKIKINLALSKKIMKAKIKYHQNKEKNGSTLQMNLKLISKQA